MHYFCVVFECPVRVYLEVRGLVEYSNEAMILIDQIDVLEDDKEDKEGFCGELCRSCPNCALLVLASYRLNDILYDNLYQVYKVLCTLSITQVACER